ncbi:hypothetical protein B0H16DRAFT_1460950 [Mycena metata]|uniref:Uncharacterized protein n=1 Tax=Mycena metata TaxID=1033252 RepID=A0AAD7N7E2_9AGAR|nr:hypothetical protein B0H16DRAFT_1460950 [Mycena metata]
MGHYGKNQGLLMYFAAGWLCCRALQEKTGDGGASGAKESVTGLNQFGLNECLVGPHEFRGRLPGVPQACGTLVTVPHVTQSDCRRQLQKCRRQKARLPLHAAQLPLQSAKIAADKCHRLRLLHVCAYILIEPRKASERSVQHVPLVELPLSAADIAAACGNGTAAAKSLYPRLGHRRLRNPFFFFFTKIFLGVKYYPMHMLHLHPLPPPQLYYSDFEIHRSWRLALHDQLETRMPETTQLGLETGGAAQYVGAYHLVENDPVAGGLAFAIFIEVVTWKAVLREHCTLVVLNLELTDFKIQTNSAPESDRKTPWREVSRPPQLNALDSGFSTRPDSTSGNSRHEIQSTPVFSAIEKERTGGERSRARPRLKRNGDLRSKREVLHSSIVVSLRSDCDLQLLCSAQFYRPEALPDCDLQLLYYDQHSSIVLRLCPTVIYSYYITIRVLTNAEYISRIRRLRDERSRTRPDSTSAQFYRPEALPDCDLQLLYYDQDRKTPWQEVSHPPRFNFG